MLLHKAFFVPFCIGLIVITAVLWHYRTSNPIKQMRPPFGQILLFAIVLVGLNGAGSYIVAKTVLSGTEVARSMKESKEQRGGDFGRSADRLPTSGAGSWDRIMPGAQSEEGEEE